MEQTFRPESPPILEVVIPFLIKEEIPSQHEGQESSEIPTVQPGKFPSSTPIEKRHIFIISF